MANIWTFFGLQNIVDIFWTAFLLVDCCNMDEVTLPKLWHQDSVSITLSDSKTALALALATIKIKTFFSRS